MSLPFNVGDAVVVLPGIEITGIGAPRREVPGTVVRVDPESPILPYLLDIDNTGGGIPRLPEGPAFVWVDTPNLKGTQP